MSSMDVDGFYDRAKQALALAWRERERLGHQRVSTAHLLIGLIDTEHGAAAEVWRRMSLDLTQLRLAATVIAGDDTGASIPASYSQRARAALFCARLEAASFGHYGVGTEHMMLGLLRQNDLTAAQLSRSMNMDVDHARLAILDFYYRYSGGVGDLSSADVPTFAPRLSRPLPRHELQTEITAIRAAIGDAVAAKDFTRANRLEEDQRALLVELVYLDHNPDNQDSTV